MNLLFLGGKRLLGNSLLNSFLNSKINKITVLYRSKKPDIKKKYKSKVEFIKCDRSNKKELDGMNIIDTFFKNEPIREVIHYYRQDTLVGVRYKQWKM